MSRNQFILFLMFDAIPPEIFKTINLPLATDYFPKAFENDTMR